MDTELAILLGIVGMLLAVCVLYGLDFMRALAKRNPGLILRSCILALFAFILVPVLWYSTLAFLRRWNRWNPALRETPRSRMYQVVLSLNFYAQYSSGGKYPAVVGDPTAALWLLYPKYLKDTSLLLDHEGPMRAPTVGPNGAANVTTSLRAETWYVYIQGHDPESGRKLVLYEKRSREGKRCVAWADGEVEELSDEELRAARDAGGAGQ